MRDIIYGKRDHTITEFDGYQELMNWTVPTVDSYTKCLLHFDGTDGAVTTTEETGKTVTIGAASHLTTANKVFGPSALKLTGVSGSYAVLSDSDDWYFANGNFTIDCRIRINDIDFSGDGYASIVSQKATGGTGNDNIWMLCYHRGVGFILWFRTLADGDICRYTAPYDVQEGEWYHLAVVRDGTSVYIFVNGVSISLTVFTPIESKTLPNYSASLYIGSYGNLGYWIDAEIDEFRISKGIARWTENFTPPISAYEDVFSSVSLTVDGDTDMEYVIECRNLDADDKIGLRLNNDSTAGIYGYQYLLNSAGTITAARGTEAIMYITDDSGRCSLTISNIDGFTKLILNNRSGYTSGTTIPTLILLGRVYNSTSNITSLDFLSESGNFTAGTNIRVLGRKSQ